MPKIIGASLADHRELTRQHLFDALDQLMAERPVDSLTMSEIAQRAGVGRTAVYNYFADKESLLLADMSHTVTQFADTLADALAGEDDVIERLCVYIRAHLEWTGRFHMPDRMNLRAEMSSPAGAHLRDHAHVVESLLADILQQAMDERRIPAQDVGSLVGLVHSSLSGLHLPTGPGARERAILAAQTYVLRGVGARVADLEPALVDHASADYSAALDHRAPTRAGIPRDPAALST